MDFLNVCIVFPYPKWISQRTKLQTERELRSCIVLCFPSTKCVAMLYCIVFSCQKCVVPHIKIHASNVYAVLYRASFIRRISTLVIGFGAAAAAMFFYLVVLTGNFATLECYVQGEMGVRKKTSEKGIGKV